MTVLTIIDILLAFALFVFGVEAIVKIKRSEGKRIEEIRKPLIIRINIIMFLTIALAAVTVANIIVNNTQR